MLLYRPLLTAYKQTTQAPARRYLLREFASPRLHAEPDELLEELATVRETRVAEEPARLVAEVSLRERLLKLNLSTRDSARESGGLWTAHADSRAVLAWMQSAVGEPELARAAGELLGRTVRSVLRSVHEEERAVLLASSGELGREASFEGLRDELVKGTQPAGAALGLARLGAAALEEALPLAVQARNLNRCAPWLGAAIAAAPSPNLIGLVTRLAKAEDAEVREQAAHALGSFSPEQAAPLLELFDAEKDRFVRLNLIRSVGQLGVPGGRQTLRKYYDSKAPEIVKTALIHAAGRSTIDEMKSFLERVLAIGGPEEIAEALQSAVCLGAPADAFLPAARAAAGSKNARLMLHGLLALAIWAPGEAFAIIRKVFSGQPGGTWFLVTYAMRYLRTDQSVPLLQKLLKNFRGTELEEIAVSAMCRHLDLPGALSTLLALARAGTSSSVLERMMLDLARHLPEEQAPEAAEAIRGMLKPGLAAGQAGPLLVALGSLGAPQDLHTIGAFVNGEAGVAAVRGIELLAQGSAAPLLEGVVKARKPAQEAALVALFRLGHAGAAEHVERLSGSGDDVPMAARALTQMALSVRHARELSRLAHLYAMLGERARTAAAAPAESDDAEPAPPKRATLLKPVLGRDMGIKPARPTRAAGVADVLGRPRRPVATDGSVPAIKPPPPQGTGDHVYRDLARHLDDEGDRATNKKMLAALAALFITVLAIGGFAWRRQQLNAAVSADETSRFSRFPPLYQEGPGEPADRAVNPGDQVEGTREAPLKLITRIKDDTLTVKGKLKVTGIDFTADVPPRARFEGQFLAGALGIDFPRGTARIVVEGARTTIELEDGAAQLEMKESTFYMSVTAGQVRVMRGVILMRTLTAGQGGEFLDGNPMGRIEDVAVPSPAAP